MDGLTLRLLRSMGDRRWPLLLLLSLLLMLAVLSCAPASTPTPSPQPKPATSTAAGLTLEFWGYERHPQLERYRAGGLALAGERVPGAEITITSQVFANSDTYLAALLDAADRGQGPDIISVSVMQLITLSETGYLEPFAACRQQHPEFGDIYEPLWTYAAWKGQVWGAPYDMGLFLLHFNKPKLRELGWSDTEIETLPDRVRRGDFTLLDVLETAEKAVAAGIVEPGFGLWFRPGKTRSLRTIYLAYGGRLYDPARQKLVITRRALEQWYAFHHHIIAADLTPAGLFPAETLMGSGDLAIFHDTVSHGRVLFWLGSLAYWHGWETEYVMNLGGYHYLAPWIGMAMIPAVARGEPGLVANSADAYAILSERASGRQRQTTACTLIAKALTPDINARHALAARRLGALKSLADIPAYEQYKPLGDNQYLLLTEPTLNSVYDNPFYFDILWKHLLATKDSHLTPQVAAAAAIKELVETFGDRIIVE